MRISGRRVLALLLVGAAAGLSGCEATASPVRPAAGAAPAVVDRAVEALSVLREWDHARAAAWAAGDRAALARLYADGSPAGRADLAMLDRWRARGWRVVEMTQQVLGVRLEARSADRIVLVVTGRLTGAVAVGHGRRTPLPATNASTRRIEIRRVEGRWVVQSVQPGSQTSN